jgi:rhodanese-related sulfurtransferase
MKTVNRNELWGWIQAKEKVTIVGAQSQEDFDKSHLPSAIRIEKSVVDTLAPQLLTDKNARIVVYCADLECQASPFVAGRLIELGYTNVFDYREGMADWTKAGHPVEMVKQAVLTA